MRLFPQTSSTFSTEIAKQFTWILLLSFFYTQLSVNPKVNKKFHWWIIHRSKFIIRTFQGSNVRWRSRRQKWRKNFSISSSVWAFMTGGEFLVHHSTLTANELERILVFILFYFFHIPVYCVGEFRKVSILKKNTSNASQHFAVIR